jgi:TetR/AcrR family transcriptional regulator
MEADCATRQKILDAALKQFAHSGYAGTSVQEIVDAAQVTKPTLYYYFPNKAGLYQALVDLAYDERYRLMREAASRGASLREQLAEILAALFAFLKQNRELVRLAFATAFAAPGELPDGFRSLKKSKRNFEFLRGLIDREIEAGRLDGKFDSHEIAIGFYGLMSIYVMAELVSPGQKLTRGTAERIVDLFFKGAGRPQTKRL